MLTRLVPRLRLLHAALATHDRDAWQRAPGGGRPQSRQAVNGVQQISGQAGSRRAPLAARRAELGTLRAESRAGKKSGGCGWLLPWCNLPAACSCPCRPAICTPAQTNQSFGVSLAVLIDASVSLTLSELSLVLASALASAQHSGLLSTLPCRARTYPYIKISRFSLHAGGPCCTTTIARRV